ncbi:MAG: flagellar hook-length control protein FliK [Thermodesulfobacteriota bacterium]|nr:flagellar hook-length control protein FliK [Thermodesulfobacteriota bacterium]
MMMKPELPVRAPTMHTEVRASDVGSPTGSFSEYVERKMNKVREKKEGFLGVDAAEKIKSFPEYGREDDGEALTVAGLLRRLMEELDKIAEDSETPGAWTFELPDSELLKKIAMNGGMSEADIALLIQQMEAEGGNLELDDFFAAFMRHFETLDDVRPITVPETELPLLETLLSKMGVPVEEIAKISDVAVTGDGKLDLTLFLEGLESIKGERSITLSEWEAEQLGDLLAKAGVSEKLQRSMLWERGFTKVELGFDRLKNLLSQGINEIESGRPSADPPAFLADLKQLLNQAGFEDGGVGWSPVVQKTLQAVYTELVELVDLATVQVSRAKETFQMISEESEIDLEGLAVRAEKADGLKLFSESAIMDLDEGMTGQSGDKHQDMLNSSGRTILSRPEFPAVNTEIPGPEMTVAHTRSQTMAHRMVSQMQQQAFDQISQGVLKGINNNDHHLVLKLHPPELGEVKVDLLIRNDHVSLSFNMENSKVKQLLESSLDQFQENLEQKGFVLDECMISAGRNDENEDAWQRFESDWKSHAEIRDETLADLTDNVLYHTAGNYDVREGGISLFV